MDDAHDPPKFTRLTPETYQQTVYARLKRQLRPTESALEDLATRLRREVRDPVRQTLLGETPLHDEGHE